MKYSKQILCSAFAGVICLGTGTPNAMAGDCSTGLWNDPFGWKTTSKAKTAIKNNLAPAFFLGSDLSEKLPVIPVKDGGYYLVGTPFDDYLYTPDGVVTEGLNGGFDTFLMANPELEKPGANRVVVAAGSREANGTTRGDRFIVGDEKKRYFAGKTSVSSDDKDILYIDKFDKGYSVIRLHGSASDYRLTRVSLPLDLSFGVGTAIVSKDTCDTVAYVRNVKLYNTSDRNFEYATVPQTTTAVSLAGGSITGIHQLGGAGSIVWDGIASATDKMGNTYSTFGASTESINGAEGFGSFFISKHDASGLHIWTQKHGTNRGTGPTEGGQSPMEIIVTDDAIYVAGLNFGTYGSFITEVEVGDAANKPAEILGLADSMRAFIGKYDLNGNLIKVRQQTPSQDTTLNPSWVLEIDNAGDLYFGGSTGEGLSIPMASAYVMKLDGDTLEKVIEFGDGGAKIFKNGPPTQYDNIEEMFISSLINNLQISNFTYGIKFVADGSGMPGKGDLFVAGVSDNGSFFGSESGWNSIWYTKIDATTANNQWQGNEYCYKPLFHSEVCTDTGGFAISSHYADLFMWGMDFDSEGNLYIGGEAAGTTSDIGHTTQDIQFIDSHMGDGDGLLIKVEPNKGNIQWIKHVGTSKSDSIGGVAVKDDIVYIAGTTRGNIEGENSGENDVYIAAIGKEGNTINTLQVGSERMDSVSAFEVSGNKLIVGGTTEGSFANPKVTDAGADAYLISIDRSAL